MKTTKRFDYSYSKEDIFYKVIYPLFAKEFLFGNSYPVFAMIIAEHFILNYEHWDFILKHWEDKENILAE